MKQSIKQKEIKASIVLLAKEQWEEALQIVKEVFMEFEAPDYCEEGIKEFMKSIEDEEFLNKHIFHGAYINGKMVGVVATRNTHHHIGLLFVDKNFQHMGIGRQLIRYILQMKDDKPITVNSSPYAHNFYKKFGFIDTDSEQTFNGIRYIPMIRVETK